VITSDTSPAPVYRVQLAAKLSRFGRVLRVLGLPVGTDRVLASYQVMTRTVFREPQDFFWSLRALFVTSREHLALFDHAFARFWCEDGDSAVANATLEAASSPEPEPMDEPGEGDSSFNRVVNDSSAAPDDSPLEEGLQASSAEVFRERDFDAMSEAELWLAKSVIAGMRLPELKIPTRRYQQHSRGGKIDMRATLRAALRQGSGFVPLVHRRRRTRPPALIIISDISGSMTRYSRMLLHFIHAVSTDRSRVHSFVFGTRLTNITRQIRERDVDVALARVSDSVLDWDGGTRIGRSLHQFNKLWSRRVLTQGAVVLFISDGLDRDAGEGLAGEMDRLHRSCRHLIWLNPLLRYDRFEPKSLGMQAIIGHVDELRTVHNLTSLDVLGGVIAGLGATRRKDEHRRGML